MLRPPGWFHFWSHFFEKLIENPSEQQIPKAADYTARNKIRDIILVSGLSPLDKYPTIICSINLIINFDGPGLRDTGRFQLEFWF
jgi:hypothetical protein